MQTATERNLLELVQWLLAYRLYGLAREHAMTVTNERTRRNLLELIDQLQQAQNN